MFSFELPEKANATLQLAGIDGKVLHSFFAGKTFAAGKHEVQLPMPQPVQSALPPASAQVQDTISVEIGRGSTAVVVDPGNLPKSGLQPSDALAWKEDGDSLALSRVQAYYATPVIFETRWTGTWQDLGLVLSRDPAAG